MCLLSVPPSFWGCSFGIRVTEVCTLNGSSDFLLLPDWTSPSPSCTPSLPMTMTKSSDLGLGDTSSEKPSLDLNGKVIPREKKKKTLLKSLVLSWSSLVFQLPVHCPYLPPARTCWSSSSCIAHFCTPAAGQRQAKSRLLINICLMNTFASLFCSFIMLARSRCWTGITDFKCIQNAGDCHSQEDGVSVLFSIPLTKHNGKPWVILYEINIRGLWTVERESTDIS